MQHCCIQGREWSSPAESESFGHVPTLAPLNLEQGPTIGLAPTLEEVEVEQSPTLGLAPTMGQPRKRTKIQPSGTFQHWSMEEKHRVQQWTLFEPGSAEVIKGPTLHQENHFCIFTHLIHLSIKVYLDFQTSVSPALFHLEVLVTVNPDTPRLRINRPQYEFPLELVSR